MQSTPPPSDPASDRYRELLRAEAPAPKIRSSAAVVLWRRTESGVLQVFWARRAPTMAFQGGWWAFPGGGVARADASIPVARGPRDLPAALQGLTTRPSPELDGIGLESLGPDLAPGVVIAAIRELFEETGLLLETTGEFSTDEAARGRQLRKEEKFADFVRDQAIVLDAGRLVFAGRWLTPPFAPVRFDNRFFLLEWPSSAPTQPVLATPQIAGPRGAELDRGEWIEPARALDRWRRGECLAAPPILHILRVLADDGPEHGLARLLDTDEANLGPFRRIEFRPGVVLLPLRTPTLPPASHTNAFLLGTHRGVLVDPATPWPDEQQRLFAAIEAWQADQELLAVWLTHHHPDHVGAATAVRQRFGVPICAHRQAVEPLARQGIDVDEILEHGDEIDLGSPANPWPLKVLHTPGHTRDHLAFLETNTRTLLAGDLFSMLSTIVIDPPDGHLGDYLASLDRMIDQRPSVAFPAHGPGAIAPADVFAAVRQHRLDREVSIRQALDRGIDSPQQLVEVIYPDLSPELRPVAERQVVAHLEHLREA